MTFLQKHFWKIFLFTTVAVFCPYLYLSFFTNPVADDFQYSVLGMRADFGDEWITQYLRRNGRYISNLLVLLNPMAFRSLTVYKLVPVIQLLFTIFSAYYFFRALTQRSFSRLITLSTTLLFLLLYISSMPSLAEGIYWYTGAVTYQSGICIALVYFGSLCDYFNSKNLAGKYLHFTICLCLLPVSTGFNEVLTLLIGGFHATVLLLHVLKRNKIRAEWWILAAVALTGTCAMIFAPGNFVRASWYGEHHNLFRSLSYTFLQCVRFAFDWISSLPFIFSIFLLAWASVRYPEKFVFIRQLKMLTLPLVPVLLFFILFACIFPAYWETNILGQQRTVNTACFFFLLLSVISTPVLANICSEKIASLRLSSKFQATILFLIIIALATTKNGYDVFTDIFYGKARAYDREMQERFITLSEKENKGKIILLKPLSEKPGSLFVLEQTRDTIDWINKCPASYFGVKAIACEE